MTTDSTPSTRHVRPDRAGGGSSSSPAGGALSKTDRDDIRAGGDPCAPTPGRPDGDRGPDLEEDPCAPGRPDGDRDPGRPDGVGAPERSGGDCDPGRPDGVNGP
ncbi:hypothetical protein AB0J52_15570, partial [Spirillospora sp. NPDC049652]